MTHDNKRYFTEGKRNVLYHFDFHPDDRLRYSKNVRETAKKHINDLEFVTVDPVNFPEILANLGLQWNFPAIALQDNRGLTFPSERIENITPDLVEDFLRSVTDGSARPAFRDPVKSATKDEVINADTRSEKMLSHDEL
ncbi:protein disulfide-isomerase [Colletotrichum liriopes]|uniref:Protein disulfide-isomerase n=1 Tax=Colletotrichum liriopes TaxID=708192 RepID=A0AA37GB47_9PEZI|nr:protein disulfide-isomerase [Colletotrichum liriopes]